MLRSAGGWETGRGLQEEVTCSTGSFPCADGISVRQQKLLSQRCIMYAYFLENSPAGNFACFILCNPQECPMNGRCFSSDVHKRNRILSR